MGIRLTKDQVKMLQRYPRSSRVWNNVGIRLSGTTRVVVDTRGVRLLRRSGS